MRFPKPRYLDLPSRTIMPAVSWSPADLGSALRLWLKADVGITLNGSTVSGWADQSGNGINFSQPTGSLQQSYQATGLGGTHPTVYSWLKLMNCVRDAAFNIGAVSSWFLVGRINSGQSHGRVFAFLNADGADDAGQNTEGHATKGMYALMQDATNQGFTASGLAAPRAAAWNTPQRYGVIHDGVNSTSYLNNVADTPGAFTRDLGGAGGNLTLGDSCRFNSGVYDNNGTFTSHSDCHMSEIVVTNTALNSTDRTKLDNYFKAKWGLS